MQQPLEPFIAEVLRTLPPGWDAFFSAPTGPLSGGFDAVLNLRAPDGLEIRLPAAVKSRLSARAAASLVPSITEIIKSGRWSGAIVLAGYASELARERLSEAGASYLDLTGNIRIAVQQPLVLIERQGASSDPNPPSAGVRSLKGPKAARIVRFLCDLRPPLGVRPIARATQTNAGYVTRVLSLLEDEDLISRDDAGAVGNVRWEALLRRWTRDYSMMESNRALQFVAARGLGPLGEQLQSLDQQYAITAVRAVPPEVQVLPVRILQCYVGNAPSAASALGLRATSTGTNVILLEPFDEVVFARSGTIQGMRTVALSQCAADLLTGSDREPAQAETLLKWMTENENVWRT